ncbi:hypothetical protein V5799_020522 [Amblyomma americanum]|uniref:Uncharacterized protein n=1 Tax=Amblyomma americanum TaxID=6943 RepID=A0AAQ4DX90_AMBAM
MDEGCTSEQDQKAPKDGQGHPSAKPLEVRQPPPEMIQKPVATSMNHHDDQPVRPQNPATSDQARASSAPPCGRHAAWKILASARLVALGRPPWGESPAAVRPLRRPPIPVNVLAVRLGRRGGENRQETEPGPSRAAQPRRKLRLLLVVRLGQLGSGR